MPLFNFKEYLITHEPSLSEFWGRAALFTGRHKPIHGGFAAAVRAAETREKSHPPPTARC